MEEQRNSVPYIVHESAMARLERIIKRLWITVLVLILLLAASNGAWIWYEAQWEDVTTFTQEVTQETEGGGDNRFIGGDYYGPAESQSDQNNQP